MSGLQSRSDRMEQHQSTSHFRHYIPNLSDEMVQQSQGYAPHRNYFMGQDQPIHMNSQTAMEDDGAASIPVFSSAASHPLSVVHSPQQPPDFSHTSQASHLICIADVNQEAHSTLPVSSDMHFAHPRLISQQQHQRGLDVSQASVQRDDFLPKQLSQNHSSSYDAHVRRTHLSFDNDLDHLQQHFQPEREVKQENQNQQTSLHQRQPHHQEFTHPHQLSYAHMISAGHDQPEHYQGQDKITHNSKTQQVYSLMQHHSSSPSVAVRPTTTLAPLPSSDTGIPATSISGTNNDSAIMSPSAVLHSSSSLSSSQKATVITLPHHHQQHGQNSSQQKLTQQSAYQLEGTKQQLQNKQNQNQDVFPHQIDHLHQQHHRQHQQNHEAEKTAIDHHIYGDDKESLQNGALYSGKGDMTSNEQNAIGTRLPLDRLPDDRSTISETNNGGVKPSFNSETDAPRQYLFTSLLSAKVLDILLHISTNKGYGAFILGFNPKRAPKNPRFPYVKIFQLIQAPLHDGSPSSSRYFFQSSIHKDEDLAQFDSNGVTPLLELRRIMLKGNGEADSKLPDTLSDLIFLKPNGEPLLRYDETEITCETVLGEITDKPVERDDEAWWSDITKALGIMESLDRNEIFNHAEFLAKSDSPFDRSISAESFLLPLKSDSTSKPGFVASIKTPNDFVDQNFSLKSGEAMYRYDNSQHQHQQVPENSSLFLQDGRQQDNSSSISQPDSFGGMNNSLTLLADTALHGTDNQFLPNYMKTALLKRSHRKEIRLPSNITQTRHVRTAIAIALHQDQEIENRDTGNDISNDAAIDADSASSTQNDTKTKTIPFLPQAEKAKHPFMPISGPCDLHVRSDNAASQSLEGAFMKFVNPNQFSSRSGLIWNDLLSFVSASESDGRDVANLSSPSMRLRSLSGLLVQSPNVLGQYPSHLSNALSSRTVSDQIIPGFSDKVFCDSPNVNKHFPVNQHTDVASERSKDILGFDRNHEQVGSNPYGQTVILSQMLNGNDGSFSQTTPVLSGIGNMSTMQTPSRTPAPSLVSTPASAPASAPACIVQPAKPHIDLHWPEEWLKMSVVDFNRFVKNKKLSSDEVENLKRAR